MKEAIEEGAAAGLDEKELSSALTVLSEEERAVHLIETGASGDLKWGGIAAAANGRLYCAPRLRSSARSQREIHWQQLLRAARSIR